MAVYSYKHYVNNMLIRSRDEGYVLKVLKNNIAAMITTALKGVPSPYIHFLNVGHLATWCQMEEPAVRQFLAFRRLASRWQQIAAGGSRW